MQAYLLREKFLEFFKNKKHKIVESDSLAPKGDPTVLFTPAGMNQFKKEFLGFDSGAKRVATCQRCLRTDDLDKVGVTSGHHTFFEMLGNFSFGDYFKEEAIAWAWEFLTGELKINEDKLWASVYKDDGEAYRIWLDKIKLPAERIIKLGDKENFWPSEAKVKGPNGPCGPCSEIFFDQGSVIGCKKPDCNPSCNCGRFVEVWNMVFTQFDRKPSGLLEPLPKKNIDTGMGLERLAAVMQGALSNFETDLFVPLVKEIVSSISPSTMLRADGERSRTIKYQVSKQKELTYAIADHIRAVTFAIYDGILPSNEARGYVIRKLIRKGTLHLRELGFTQPFLYKLVPLLTEIMEPYYPGLKERKENIAEIILTEEKNFISALNSSGALFKEKFRVFQKQQDPEKVGRIAFKLYDTYGMPPELTEGWLEKQGISISREAFDQELQEQKTRSKLQSTMQGDVFVSIGLDYGAKQTNFLGYKNFSIKAKVIGITKDNLKTKRINKGDTAWLILDKTVFYPESGGQIGDTGEITKGKNIFEVLDTQKTGKVILHSGRVKSGSFKTGDFVSAKINTGRRLSIARNHTATHLLQAALRKVLGEHIQQQGSLVAEDRLRFDFTHFKALDIEQLERVEEIVNNYIINNYNLKTNQMALAEAKKTGALAFFQERYVGRVRVVSVEDISLELCAGTHLNNSGQIGLFKIIQESSIASGIRRIEATTGYFAYKLIKEEERIIEEVASALNVSRDRITQQLGLRLAQIKELEKQEEINKLEVIKNSLDKLIQDAQVLNSINFISKTVENLDIDLLRKGVDLIKQKTNNAVIALGSKSKGKAFLVIGVSGDLCGRGIDASKLIKEIAQEIGGSGGGRNDFAQAGGNRPENLESAFTKLRSLISQI